MIETLGGDDASTCSTLVNTLLMSTRQKVNRKKSMRVWLTRTVKIPQYINNFVDNGYDDINIAAEMITDNKLIKIGMNKLEKHYL